MNRKDEKIQIKREVVMTSPVQFILWLSSFNVFPEIDHWHN